MNDIVRVTFDPSTEIEPLTAKSDDLALTVARYLVRLSGEQMRVDYAETFGVGAAYTSVRLFATFEVASIGDAK
ncbi:hypothetical protein [Streptomyces violascens]|uniref:Uncharacterized protein n=1 Tax=Streptomyces violascens TaxID=67381 RepID=A0ABQ3QX60_9ACTN|nr:hypothetical protein [Streptomyces violascens]GGU12908.1 hypothetical protein GCM10010289_38160 [Streptomyces violascens]GHI41866.1 hypothetical protein Sviol_62740 [Streptomyces violascens]